MKRTKHDVLTEEEMAVFSIKGDVERAVRDYAAGGGKDPSEVNVLDWGCGRGRSVARLREWGFNAFGVDIDSVPIGNGKSLFSARGLESDAVLRPLDRLDSFPDGFFHVIFSEQVFEHVEDIEAFAQEAWRLTAPGGTGVHSYPGRRNVIEEHLFMPLVHWLPKDSIRRSWIKFFLRLGRDPGWSHLSDQQLGDRAEAYYEYSTDKTFYRSARKLRSIMEERGFEAQARPAHHKWWRPPRWLRFLDGFPIGNMLLLTRKPTPQD